MPNIYYYLAASLPLLSFDGKIPFSVEEFLHYCERMIPKDDYTILYGLLNKNDIHTSHPVIAQVEEFERGLNNHIVIYRAKKLNKDAKAFLHGDFLEQSEMSALINHAANADDPLEGDKLISKARWQFYDELMTTQFFNFAFILLYGLKLKIVERYHHIASPKGREIYEELKKIEFPQEVGLKG